MAITTTQKLGISIAVLGFMAGSATQLTDIFAPLGSLAPVIVKEIVSLSGFASGILGIVLSFLTGQGSTIKAVVEMAKDPNSPVQGVITTNDVAGKALAASIPGPISSAGSNSAAELVKS